MKKAMVIIGVLGLVAVLFIVFTDKLSPVMSSPNPQEQQTTGNAIELGEDMNEKDTNEKDMNETKTDSGRYQGQADSNFIEIKISGVPEDKATRVFMLSEEVKVKFEQFGLNEDQDIKFEYFENENKQLVITKIEKI